MIEVAIRLDDGQTTFPLATIRIKNHHRGDPTEGNYRVEIMVQHGEHIGLYSTTVSGFDRENKNVLALVKEALNQLDDSQLGLDSGTLSATNTSRRQHPSLRAIQSWYGELRNH